jgi:WD40 repeat protein
MTGDLLRVIVTVSTISANVLYPHPLDPTVAVTGGDDGYVNVWDIDNEEKLSSHLFPNLSSEMDESVKIHDACFSPDGSRISVTDSLGRLSILGIDDPQRYCNVATEQYYSTDYQDIMMDNDGFAIDVGTQLPVHEAPLGPLCRNDGTPLDRQPVGRMRGPEALSQSEVQALLAEQRKNAAKVGKLMDRTFLTFRRNRIQNREPKQYRNGHSTGSVTNGRYATDFRGVKSPANGSSSSSSSSRVMTLADYKNMPQPQGESSSEEDKEIDYVDADERSYRRSVRNQEIRNKSRNGHNSRKNRLAKRTEKKREMAGSGDENEYEIFDEETDNTDEETNADIYGSDGDGERSSRVRYNC